MTEQPTTAEEGVGSGSAAEGQGGGILASVTGALSTAGASISSTATSAYQQAPDLGVTSTVNKLSGAAAAATSTKPEEEKAAPSESDPAVYPNGDVTGDVKGEVNGEDEEDLDGPGALRKRREQRIQQSKEAGPSCESRLGKLQSEVGIEDGIPTSAGAGTTHPQDTTVQQATTKNTTRNQANVPADFEQVDSPSQFAGGKAEKISEGGGESATQQGQSTAEQDSAETTNQDGGSAGKRSLGQKIKDGFKGEAKVLSGHVKRDQEQVQAGKAIRKGEA
ncbi:hypothetical protein BCV69DRAFT_313900, partial [Microstroma glucosiphilum]